MSHWRVMSLNANKKGYFFEIGDAVPWCSLGDGHRHGHLLTLTSHSLRPAFELRQVVSDAVIAVAYFPCLVRSCMPFLEGRTCASPRAFISE